MNTTEKILELGLDVGSTTVKVALLSASNEILWKDYRRHNSHQAECSRSILEDVKAQFPDIAMRVAITGSGARALASALDAQFIQEVNAVTLAVETFFPDAGSVVELGGQDAKVIIWKGDENQRTTLTYMNDKCAGGTGSTIDKILAKIGLSSEEMAQIMPEGRQVHQVAAKCGVFAETDVIGLLKAGISREDIFISLCHAIVKQNLEVLVRGNVLPEKVLLLGGPNTFIPAFAPIWREHIKMAWDIHGYAPEKNDLTESIIVPDGAHYFAAIGAVLFARESGHQSEYIPRIIDFTALDAYIVGEDHRKDPTHATCLPGLVSSVEEFNAFRQAYEIPQFEPPHYEAGTEVSVYIGIDGGSTSTKMVLIHEDTTVVYRDYLLSSGNPLDDVRVLFERLRQWRDSQKITLDIRGAGATGYAAKILTAGLNLDCSVVETVAHMRSATALYGDIDLICDVGGQDIKVLFMKNRRVVDFRLNTQCSGGNGYFLQGMANQFNIPVEEYADYAFRANRAPKFNYGCAVFMEQDRVNFQQAGWSKEEMMSGLAQVLPLNIWNYVVQESNLARLGRRFVLQGGTQKNLAAVKAQVDFIKRKVPGAEVFVHRYADIAGAIGAAIETKEHLLTPSTFIGIDAASELVFDSVNNNATRCAVCPNHCRRTFVDITSKDHNIRFISGNLCEKGGMSDEDDVRGKIAALHATRKQNPDLTAFAAQLVFSEFDFEVLPKAESIANRQQFYPLHGISFLNKKERVQSFQRSASEAAYKRSQMVVGIPRLLNQFYYNPLFSTYFRTLGIKVVYSDFTNDRLWSEGNKWGAIDPCFPAKVAPAHIWQLLNNPEVTVICFPIVTHLDSIVENTLGNTACTIQMGTPEVVEAVFTRERHLFREKNISYWDPSLNLDRSLEACDQMFLYFGEILGITRDENAWAYRQGEHALQEYLDKQRESFAKIMNRLIDEDKIGLLMLGHPYHHDPGLNHRIPEEFSKRGYPVFTIESLPVDQDFLDILYPEGAGKDIRDVWLRNFNRNTNGKIWAAKIAARHPNMGVIDLSSFKCGHDAPTYSYIDQILESSETPHFMFHDIDQNRPEATFKIRIDTIDYFLNEYVENLKKKTNHEK